MTVYGILGGGDCPKNIIEDGLKDIGVEGNTFIIVGHKKPSPNEERAFDFIIENEAVYELVTTNDNPAPRILVDSADAMYEDVDDAHIKIIEMLADRDGILLLLWDENDEEAMNDITYHAYDNKVVTKELSNGLAPIAVQETTTTFTEQEFESMPPAVQKRNTTSNTTSTVTDLTVTVPERPQMVAPDGDCMITVVMPNGTVISTPATIEEVRVLLGLSGGS